MNKLVIILAFLITFFNYGYSQTRLDKSQLLFIQAKNSLMRGDSKIAKDKIDSAIILDNSKLEYFIFRGDLLCQTNHFPEGIKDYDHVIKIQPSNYDARNYRAIATMIHGEYDISIVDNKFLIKYYPDSISPYINLGKTLDLIKACDSAIYFLDISIKKDSKRMDAYEELANAFFLKKNYKKSIDIINKAIDKDLVSLTLINNRGYNYIMLKEYALAKQDFEKVIKIKVDDYSSKMAKIMAMNNLGFIEYKNKNYNEALKWINMSIEQFQYNAFAYKNKALVYIDLNDIKSVCENLEKANKYRMKLDIEDLDLLINKYCK